MTTTTYKGAPQFPTVLGSIPPSTREEMDTAIEALQSHKDEWVAFSMYDRIMLIDRMIKDFAAIASRWVDASIQAKGISKDSLCVGEEWAAGAWPVLKNLRQLRQSLVDIAIDGHPKIAGRVTTMPNGQVAAQVFPLKAPTRSMHI